MAIFLKVVFKDKFRDLELILLFLNNKERRKFHKFISIGILLSFLDVIGIALIGLLASLIFSILTGGYDSKVVELFLSRTGLDALDQNFQLFYLSLSAVAFFVLKSFFFLIQSRQLNSFLAGVSVRLSKDLLQKLFSSKINFIQGKSREEISYALSEGAQYATLGLLTSVSAFIIESVFIFVVLFFLSLYNAYMLFALILFGFLFFRPAQKFISHQTKKFSNLRNQGIIDDASLITDTVNLFREIVLTEKQDFFVKKLESQRKTSSQAFGVLLWIQNLPRVSIETGTVLVIGLLGLVAILPGNAEKAISFLLVFTVAISRIAPSVLRIQQSIIGIGSNIGYSQQTLSLLRFLPQSDLFENQKTKSLIYSLDQGVEILFKNVDFSFFDGMSVPLFSKLNISIPKNSLVLLVGPSGAGKSTFCDLVTGFQIPENGEILLNGLSVEQFLISYPGSISYLPQRNFLISGTILENISLDSNVDSFTEQRVREALIDAGIWEFLVSRRLGIHDLLENSGNSLSGGQQQRLAIARALFFKSKLIILDEPTGALDSESTILFFEMIKKISEKCTVLVVSHQYEDIDVATHVIRFSAQSVNLDTAN
jgi:ABC-type bacteriocin/lantibiotic exporter with double-glycine peptidase domain